jgi:hypothetical protein
MPAPDTTVTIYFDFPFAPTAFTLDDPVRGELDNTTYKLYAATPVDVTSDVNSVVIRRGSESQLVPTINVGSATVQLNNEDRLYDPTYASGPYFGNIIPGRRVTIASGGITVFDGRIEDWDFTYDVSGRSVAVIECVDALGVIGRQDLDTFTATAGQTVGPRLTAVFDRAEVQLPSARAIDTGISTLQGDVVDFGTNVLNYCQDVVASEIAGWLFASRTGVMTFRSRHAALNATATIVFGGTSGIGFRDIQTSYGSEQLFNRVSVGIKGGGTATVLAIDSQFSYGIRAYSAPSTLLADTGQATDAAAYLAGIYAQPEFRVASITVELAALTSAQQAQVLSLDISSVVSVEFTPNGVRLTGDEAALEILQDSEFWIDANIDDLPARVSSSLTRSCIVSGISHDRLTNGSHTVTLSLGDADRRSFLQLDDTVFGRLDSNVLAF